MTKLPTILYLASSNQGKLREMKPFAQKIFTDSVDFQTKAPDLEAETGSTFLENAFQKARCLETTLTNAGYRSFAVLADDSGLCVDALGGRPGIDTALYAGDHVAPEKHMRKLLQELAPLNLTLPERSARYHCALACILVLSPNERVELSGEGDCEGLIAYEMQGESGFGYDPLFFLPQFQKTMAEVPDSQKQALSHRARAFEQLERQMRQWQQNQ